MTSSSPTGTDTSASVNPTETRRTISPYDRTSANNLGAVISHPLLKSSNYDEWTCGLRTTLTSQKKFGFLNGSIKQPNEDSPDFEVWKAIQALRVSSMKMTIDLALRSSISHRDVAQDLWEHLKKRFTVMNGSRFQQLKAELTCCKQRGLAIEAYFGKLNRIWDNLSAHRPLRLCKCGHYVCDLGAAQEVDREEDRVHQFLFDLDDDQFRAVRSSLVSRTPVQSLEEIYNILRQAEDMHVSLVKKNLKSRLLQSNQSRVMRRRNVLFANIVIMPVIAWTAAMRLSVTRNVGVIDPKAEH